jgi:beta-lactamase class A
MNRRAALMLVMCACGGAATNAAPKPAATQANQAPCTSAAVTQPQASMTPKTYLEKLFTEPHADAAWFHPSFSSKVPLSKVDEITKQITSSAGKLQSIRETGEHKYEVTFEKISIDATIILEDGKIQTLFVRPGASNVASLEEAVAALRALPGNVGIVVLGSGKPLAQGRENDALAVGSSFKLPVLVELRNRIEKEKKLSWDKVVTLDPKWKSLPSGMLHEWPNGTPLTVQTLASLMISISDNTATDAVIHLLGRSSLASYGASPFRPFLMTSEMFRLKAKGNEALLERFRKASPAEREKLLAEIEKLPLPKAEDYPTGVTATDVEWMFSASELCSFMAKVHDLPLMGINPGVAKKSDWDRIAYKGGSEPGVINMTTWVEKGAKSYCVSATWNDDKKLDDARFGFAYGAILGFLAKTLP